MKILLLIAIGATLTIQADIIIEDESRATLIYYDGPERLEGLDGDIQVEEGVAKNGNFIGKSKSVRKIKVQEFSDQIIKHYVKLDGPVAKMSLTDITKDIETTRADIESDRLNEIELLEANVHLKDLEAAQAGLVSAEKEVFQYLGREKKLVLRTVYQRVRAKQVLDAVEPKIVPIVEKPLKLIPAAANPIIDRDALQKNSLEALKKAEALAVKQAEEVSKLRADENQDHKYFANQINIFKGNVLSHTNAILRRKESFEKYQLEWKKLKIRHQREQSEWKVTSGIAPFEFENDFSEYRALPHVDEAEHKPEKTTSDTAPIYQDVKDGWLSSKLVAEWCAKFEAWDTRENCFNVTNGHRFVRTAINACGSLPYWNRISPCLTSVANKTFEPTLVTFCKSMSGKFDVDHKFACIQRGAGASVNEDAVKACLRVKYSNWKVDCLAAIVNKILKDADVIRCSSKRTDEDMVFCFQSLGQNITSGAVAAPRRQGAGMPPAPGADPYWANRQFFR